MSRPEDQLPAELFYGATEARKYTTSSRIQSIQSEMTYRALELLDLTSPSLILDIGCGSGLSGEILSAVPSLSSLPSSNEDLPAAGTGPHTWIGLDISPSMLALAHTERDVDGDLFLADAGQGIPFRAGTFDAAISISALQWLCNAETSEARPDVRLKRFFDGLYAALRRGGRAVCQFYPRDAKQKDMICGAAVKAGFGAGLLEDGMGTKSAKIYLVLTVGGGEIRGEDGGRGDISGVVRGMEGVDIVDGRRKKDKRITDKKGGKAWILKKKEQMRSKGKVVKNSSKYTGRKRGPTF